MPQRFASQAYAFDKHIMNGLDGLPRADVELAPHVTWELLTEAVGDVPDDWLDGPHGDRSTVRGWYVDYLLARAAAPREWLGQAS